MTESELREELAPRIAAKLLARCPRLSLIEADQLAHEVIATVQGAVLAAQLGGSLNIDTSAAPGT